jgi:hypothetical protein
LLVRAGTRSRVAELVALYGEAGLEVVALTSGLGDARRLEILKGLKDGTIRAVAVVGMLGEGFDLPRLRLAAYHDKHKSVASTIQLIGRLVRSHSDFPQPSVLVTVQDADVYPGLRGALWELYQEDADWPSLLAGIIDDAVAAEAADKAFANQLARSPAELSLESVRPLVLATVFEVPDDWAPLFLDGTVPAGLISGDVIRGRQVLYSTVTPENRTLLLVTEGTRSPRWNFDSGLDAPDYALHLITYLRPKGASRRAMLLGELHRWNHHPRGDRSARRNQQAPPSCGSGAAAASFRHPSETQRVKRRGSQHLRRWPGECELQDICRERCRSRNA